MPPIRLLIQLAIAAQVREVDFAAHHQNRRKQRHEKGHLRFAKTPTFVSRLCTMASIAIYPVPLGYMGTLSDR